MPLSNRVKNHANIHRSLHKAGEVQAVCVQVFQASVATKLGYMKLFVLQEFSFFSAAVQMGLSFAKASPGLCGKH